MRLKLYRAPTMADGMRQVRDDLGADALILSTRRVSDGIEVTAAIDDEPRATPATSVQDPRSLRQLDYHGTPQKLARQLANGNLAEALSAQLTFGSLALTQGSRPIIFAGPPGAGKTLTVARLATRLVLSGTPPFVITADGKRAGAAEQLASFTRLLGLDLVVASQPVALARALARRQSGAPVLIDMPGGSPFSSAQSTELAAMTSTANGCVAVVLPAGLDPSEAFETAAAYAETGAEYLVATRLDVARRIGCILAAASSGLTLVEAGIGDGAADGLVPMTAELLASRLMAFPESQENPH